MKKLLTIAVALVLCFTFSVTCLAQPAAKKKVPVQMNPAQAKQRQAQNLVRMFIATSKIVATTDHGVVVLVGNKLYKYDKNLRLIKEQQIKINPQDFEALTGR